MKAIKWILASVFFCLHSLSFASGGIDRDINNSTCLIKVKNITYNLMHIKYINDLQDGERCKIWLGYGSGLLKSLNRENCEKIKMKQITCINAVSNFHIQPQSNKQ